MVAQRVVVTETSASTGARLVQLPADTERSRFSAYTAVFTAQIELAISTAGANETGRPLLLGILSALLHRYTQQATICLDAFLPDDSGYRRIELDLGIAGDLPVSSAIDEAGVALGAASELRPSTTIVSSNVAVTFVRAAGQAAAEGALEAALQATSVAASHDINFVFSQAGESTALRLAYNAVLFRPETVRRLLDSFVVLLSAARQDRTTVIEQLPLLSPTELHALTIEQHSGSADHPPVPVHRLFAALAKTQPDALAVSWRDERLSYAALDERSSRLAHHLIALDVGPGVPVAVCVRPSLDILVAMLAIWKARGVYLPLDPTHPQAVIGRMLSEAQPRIVLTSSALVGLTADFPQLCFDTDAALYESQPATAPVIEPSLTDTAYLFYTSGTTGKAKGVVATQGNLVQYVHSAAQKYAFSAADAFVSLARYTFSISLFELVSPLCCGASLRILDRDDVLTPERLFRALDEVTVLHAGPSLLGSLFRYLRATPSAQRSLPRMRHASSGGDMVSPSVMEEMKRVFPNAELFVIYGCTEVSCMGTTFVIPRATKVDRTFVGKPFPNVTARVLDSNRSLVPFGVVGEICFAGPGVVRGYLDRPELTAEKFVERDGQRFYSTGDVGRQHPDGNIEILGRRDFQVQLRGIRVELAGIEKTMQELALAAQCAVIAKTLDDGDVRLVAFVVNPTDDNVTSFRRTLAAQLPDYMIPQHVVVLEALPLTANGKLDRNRLREMPWEKQLGVKDKTEPTNERERKVAEIFARVLGTGEVGIDDNFFDLGGDSLHGVAALAEIERAIQITVPPHVLFASGTVRALANYSPDSDRAEPKPILLNATSSGPAVYMIAGMHVYRELARRLDGVCAAYGVFGRHELDVFDPALESRSVPELARDYVTIIRRHQPKGPYRLLGYSFAGIVTYEVAQQLQRDGEEVSFLALVDAALPEWHLGWRFRVAQFLRLPFAPPRHVAAFLARRLNLIPRDPEWLRYSADQTLGPLEERRDDAKRAAAARYIPTIRPFAGNVALIVSSERLRHAPLHSPSCGWGPHIPGLEIDSVDVHHLLMLSKEPHVSKIAAIVAERLRSSESPDSSRPPESYVSPPSYE
jgi:amino acid adenylation domain-containing protein